MPYEKMNLGPLLIPRLFLPVQLTLTKPAPPMGVRWQWDFEASLLKTLTRLSKSVHYSVSLCIATALSVPVPPGSFADCQLPPPYSHNWSGEQSE